MATSFVQPLLQLFDDYGTVLAGGLLYSYEAGTTTPLATYQDLAGATANANPTVLDAAGRATVRVTNGVAYKFVLTDADDNEVQTIDNVTVGISDSAAGEDYLVHLSYVGTPGAQGFMGGHIFDSDVDFPIDFEGAQASVETNPGSDYVVSIRKNGTEVGTITYDYNGIATYDTTGGVTVSFVSGDRMTWIAPDSVGTAANFTMTIPGAVA